MDWLAYLFYLLVAEQILQGLYGFWRGVKWLKMARRRARAPLGFYTPRVAVFCPVKGLEPGLEQNLQALTQFDYPAYEVFLAVAGSDDPAFPLLQRLAAASARPVRLVRAGRPRGCGEKVNNLRAAVEQAGQGFEVFVFVDSDGRLPRRWLAHIVAPLADERLGAATAFRWLIPREAGLWSALAAAWNAPIATYLGEHRGNFCWGGGTAIRRERFEQVGAMNAWRSAVSDDFALTNELWRAGLDIAFVPEALVASPVQFNRRDFFEFTNRQFIITRVYAPGLWKRALVAHALYCGAVLSGLALWLARLAAGLPGLQILLLALVPTALSALQGMLRLAAIVELLPEWREQLLARGWAWTLLAPLVPCFSFYNALVASFRRKIVWRGTRYELVSPVDTRIAAH